MAYIQIPCSLREDAQVVTDAFSEIQIGEEFALVTEENSAENDQMLVLSLDLASLRKLDTLHAESSNGKIIHVSPTAKVFRITQEPGADQGQIIHTYSFSLPRGNR